MTFRNEMHNIQIAIVIGNNNKKFSYHRGTRWRTLLRYCAVGQKVADSVPNGVTDIFQRFNPSGRTIALK
jgi:hypothetical protein